MSSLRLANHPTGLREVTAVVVAGMMTGLITAAAASANPGTPDADHAAPRVSAIRFAFGKGITHGADGIDYIASAHAGPRAQVLVANGGHVAPIRRFNHNGAVDFPNACHDSPPCPRALLSVPDTDVADPRTRAFSYGATIRMNTATAGQNVIQKGLQRSQDPMDQWKLQVDGASAKPSCVVADDSSSGLRVYAAHAKRSLLGEGWVSVRCDRTATRLLLTMTFPNGQTCTASRAIPAHLAISNKQPMLIGSNGMLAGDDQFVGRLDGAFFKIE
jgi:hypothetical protein